MRAGRLKDRIRLERPVQTRDPVTGSTNKAWQVVCSRAASIAPINGSEQAFLGSEMTEANTLITLRYDGSMQSITSEWRVVDTRTMREYDIEYHDPISSGLKQLKIRCVHRSK